MTLRRIFGEAASARTPPSSTSPSLGGPTPYHRRSSWIPRDRETIYKSYLKRIVYPWHFFDNNGSYNGWFDWLPEWMRVGYWSPIVVVYLIGFYSSMIYFKPQPLIFETATTKQLQNDDRDFWFYADASIFAWGTFVMIVSSIRMGSLGAFYISYTGWSWMLLTARPGFAVLGYLLDDESSTSSTTAKISALAKTLESSLRFPVVVAAFVTFTIWNSILLPMIYFFAMKEEKHRKDFLKFNFGFLMTNIHLLNLPLAMINTVIGGNSIRLFTLSDLWASYLVVVLYSMMYLFVLDRIGLHFYPIFCPRTAWSTISFVLVLGFYYFLMERGNDLIIKLHPELRLQY